MNKLKIIALLCMWAGILACNTKKVKDTKMKESEEVQIENYIKKNDLKIDFKSNSGLRFILNQEAKDGMSLKQGQSVKVKYSGRLLNDKQFDAGSFNFVLGIGQVITGFDEGIAKLKVGEKGTLIFPSSIGYGAAGAGSDIPPNSPLIFEIEVLAAR
ncbi:FKBP-type peptidyl-prolyl cis-trans isomerase [Lacihabitans sp. CCS-44]|uniref:FKBP-type peptidyl-prolyl cis-trans isomerase n=1 Tax=Lacihabitans sp. CCS-44 TaxID=2487331 RepID=UPI0020CF248E|nr:FKBP-type peptidyl-prolyl cis-trans isomerase [Lacihabitans sp. CCS-44]MCP9755348.1 FKBP-type peptidyl-prolyl cis-trans isomerase [Lacihabitans sp. CCS-44]